MLHEFMCLTIPKKVVEIRDNSIVVEDHTGSRQEMKSLLKSLKVGDFIVSQQNIAIEKIEKKYAQEIFDMINGGK